MGMKATALIQPDENSPALELIEVPPGKRNLKQFGKEENLDLGAKMIQEMNKDNGTEGVSETDEEAEDLPNPLYWFGFFPPQPLRQAQNQFKEALKIVVLIASEQNKLNNLIEEYKVLKQKKNSLQKQK